MSPNLGEKLGYLVTRFKLQSATENTRSSEIRGNRKGREFSTGIRASCTSTNNKNMNESEININNPTSNLQ